MDTKAKRSLFDNLDKNADLAYRIDEAIRLNAPADFRGNIIKERVVRRLIAEIVGDDENKIEEVFEIVSNQHEY